MFLGAIQRTLLTYRKDSFQSALQHGWSSWSWLNSALPTATAFGGTSTIISRSKHSNTVKKRLFKFNPGRIRKLRAQGIFPRWEELPERQFKKVHKFTYLPNTWTEPPPTRPEYPFTVTRTKNKPFGATGFLPVYTKFRCVH